MSQIQLRVCAFWTPPAVPSIGTPAFNYLANPYKVAARSVVVGNKVEVLPISPSDQAAVLSAMVAQKRPHLKAVASMINAKTKVGVRPDELLDKIDPHFQRAQAAPKSAVILPNGSIYFVVETPARINALSHKPESRRQAMRLV